MLYKYYIYKLRANKLKKSKGKIEMEPTTTEFRSDDLTD